MKKLFLTPTLLFSAILLFAGPIDSLLSAFSNNNFSTITEMFSSSVQLSTPNKNGVFSKAQAGTIVKQFLSKNKVISAKKIHSGASGAGAKFCIISISCAKGNKFRVNAYLKNTASGWKIHELKFSK